MAGPVVEHFNTTIFLNSVVKAEDFISVTDPDGDAIMHYDFQDYQSDPTTGFFRFRGIAQPQGTQFRIAADELQFLEYVGGSRIAWEGFRVIATDVTGAFSTAADSGRLYTVRENVTRPNVQNRPFQALANEATPIEPHVRAFDPDGHPITQYFIRDSKVDNGFLTINGEAVPQREYRLVKVEDLGTVFYNTVGAAAEEFLQIFAYDGELWSGREDNQITTVANVNLPVAQFTRGDVISREVIPMAPLANVTDDDGNSIKWMEFWNTSPHAVHGDLIFKGIVQPRKQWIRVQADELDQLFYAAPNRDFVQQIRYRGYDGKFRSGNSTISITTTFEPIPVPPTIASVAPQYNVEQVEVMGVASLFNASSTADPINQYQIYDGNSGSFTGQFLVNDQPLEPDVVHTFSPAGFNNVDYISGPYIVRSDESVYARAGNGEWSPWARVNMHTEPEFVGAFETNPVNPASWRNVLNQPFGTLTLTYSFMQTFPDYNTGAAVNNEDPPEQFSQFSIQQREGTNRGLANLESFADVEFVQIADSATNQLGQQGGILRFGNYFLEEPEASAFAFFPSLAPEGGDSWYDMNVLSRTDWGPGTFSYATLLHEVGHAMGLKHPHGGPDNMEPGPWLPRSTDYESFTVMTYTPRPDFLSARTYQIYDIYNLQQLYGPNMTYETGDNLYDINFLGDPRSTRSIWDAGGVDEFSAAGTSADAILDLRPGQFSSIGGTAENIGLAFDVDIENATGGDGNDMLIGNYMDNMLVGGVGDDVLEGRSGNDSNYGGSGSDRYIWGVADNNDMIDEQRGAGRDVIELRDFPQLDVLEEDLRFSLDGRDLIVDLKLDNSDHSEGTLVVKDYLWGRSRVETLELNGTRIDLTNLVSQISAVNDTFAVSTDSSVLGNLVVPV